MYTHVRLVSFEFVDNKLEGNVVTILTNTTVYLQTANRKKMSQLEGSVGNHKYKPCTTKGTKVLVAGMILPTKKELSVTIKGLA